MRKYQQKLILDMLKLCENRHEAMRHLKEPSFDAMVENLYSCLGYARQIGEFIEQIHGYGSQTVTLLEEYCDLLSYQMQKEQGFKVKTLKKQLIKIMDKVETELAVDRIELAFFPYQSSMADSLESIYLCAKADPSCDAYWIPVPYYDKNTDGSLGKMHYEGDQYPGYLEVVDWETYDTKMRHPDIIVTHYPYDECNLVTTIHPNYYSGVLREQTDFLVYVDYGIPYWVPNEPKLCATADNVVLYPFMINCNLYVAYSSEMAECCRLTLSLSEVTKKWYTASMVQEKVLALGSPKFDKVLSTKRQDCVLPPAWETAIGNRKVLLYNTGLVSLLKNDERFLEKIKSVIELVSKHKDIVLWWRPHPLTVDTLCSMRPHLLAEYQKIVAAFQSAGQGIYDDTADLHRGIAWSDGCLTDESSVMFLYLAIGKPFSITSMDKKLAEPVHNCDTTFTEPLKRRIENMKAAKGANVGNWNCCIWWDNFLEEDVLNRVHYDNFLDRFIHYIVHEDQYPQAQEYRELQLGMFHDFVENSDGTAGQKTYEYCKQKILGVDK